MRALTVGLAKNTINKGTNRGSTVLVFSNNILVKRQRAAHRPSVLVIHHADAKKKREEEEEEDDSRKAIKLLSESEFCALSPPL